MTQLFLSVLTFLMGFTFAHMVQIYLPKFDDVHYIFLSLLLLILFFFLPLGIYLGGNKKNKGELNAKNDMKKSNHLNN